LTHLPCNVSRKERRELALGRTTQKIPQLLVIFTFHIPGQLN